MQITKEYLEENYVKLGKSSHEIARELNTNPNFVLRALRKHGLPVRNKGEAQIKAMQAGRSQHPTKGRKRSDQEKSNIGHAIAYSWQTASPEKMAHIKQERKARWDAKPDYAKENFRTAAARAVRRAALEGSKLEKFLIYELQVRYGNVQWHANLAFPGHENMHVDFYLPARALAIEVNGPSHYEPVYGEEYLEKRQERDLVKRGIILDRKLSLLVIKNVKVDKLGEHHKDRLRKKLFDCVDNIQASSNMFYEIEVD